MGIEELDIRIVIGRCTVAVAEPETNFSSEPRAGSCFILTWIQQDSPIWALLKILGSLSLDDQSYHGKVTVADRFAGASETVKFSSYYLATACNPLIDSDDWTENTISKCPSSVFGHELIKIVAYPSLIRQGILIREIYDTEKDFVVTGGQWLPMSLY